MSTLLTISDAATDLGISTPTLWRWIQAGAPVARLGGRGRGNRTLICPAAVRRWRSADKNNAALLSILAEVPELMARSAEEAHRLAPDKRGSAWSLVAGWQLSVSGLHDRLAESGIDVSEQARPAGIERLLKTINQ